MVSDSETSKIKESKRNIMRRKALSAETAVNMNDLTPVSKGRCCSRTFEENGQLNKSRKSKRHRSISRRKKLKSHKCSMLSNKCPDHVSHEMLMLAAANDRKKREHASFERMIKEFRMTELTLCKAAERQIANVSMQALAFNLEVMCIVALGIMGILVQHYFDTRGHLHYYLNQMTFELLLLLMLVLNTVIPGLGTNTINIGAFGFAVGVNLCHILMTIRLKGILFTCETSKIMLQHCLIGLIPTRYHTLYISTFLLVLHLAIVLILVFMLIFYEGSLDWYLDHTPGSPQWITNQPLHIHDRVRDKNDEDASKSDSCAGFSEQSENTVQQTATDTSGKKHGGLEEATISRSYILDVPGIDKITGSLSYVKRNPPKTAGTPSTSAHPVPSAKKSEEGKPVGKPIEVPSDFTTTNRNPAGMDDVELGTETAYISKVKMRPLISRLACLNNKNFLEEQEQKKRSEYMW